MPNTVSPIDPAPTVNYNTYEYVSWKTLLDRSLSSGRIAGVSNSVLTLYDRFGRLKVIPGPNESTIDQME